MKVGEPLVHHEFKKEGDDCHKEMRFHFRAHCFQSAHSDICKLLGSAQWKDQKMKIFVSQMRNMGCLSDTDSDSDQW